MKRKINISLFLSVAIILLIIKLNWLAIGFFLLGVFYLLFTSKLSFIRWLRNQKVLSYCLAFIGILVLAISIRLFIFEIYSIPTGSMENTLIPGDKVLVSKLNYGPRLPGSPFEVPWFNVFYYLNKKTRAKADSSWWNYHRLKGYSQIARGDIIVFQPPIENNDVFIKRCVALPGDTIQVIHSHVYINGQMQTDPPDSRFIYSVWYNDAAFFKDLIDSLGIQAIGAWYRKQNNFIELNLTNSQKKQLVIASVVDSVTVKKRDKDLDYSFADFPGALSESNNYGPIRIPGKGNSLKINKGNVEIYSETLTKFEKTDAHLPDYEFPNKNISVSVNNNYYFMMGDNRYYSNDSRVWGFVPEQNIVGRAVLIIYSKNRNKIKWNRFFKKI